MTGILKSIGMLTPTAATQPVQPVQPVQLQNPFAAPTRTELQSMLTRAGNAGVRVATADDAAAVARLMMAGHDERDALADVVWATKMGASVTDAVAKVLAARQSAGGQLPKL